MSRFTFWLSWLWFAACIAAFFTGFGGPLLLVSSVVPLAGFYAGRRSARRSATRGRSR